MLRKSQTPEQTNLRIENLHAPVFLTKLPNEIILNYNDKLILLAEVSALPNANFFWSVNGNAIESLNDFKILNEINRSTLVVNPPVCIGNYNVVAKNTLGSVSNDNDTKVLYSDNTINNQISIQPNNLLEGFIFISLFKTYKKSIVLKKYL